MPTFDTPEPISVAVELGVGDIRMVASDRTDTTVDVRPSDPTRKSDVTAAEQTRVEYTGGRLLIKAPKGWRQWTSRVSESIDVRIDLPAGSEVRGAARVASMQCRGHLGECSFQTGVGDVRLEDAGPVELKTGVGDITVDRAAGRAELTTGTGAVEIGSIDGTAVVKNSNGDTRIGDVSGDLRVSSANGKITIDRAQATIVAKTAFGDVRLDSVTRGAVVAQSGFGTVEVGVLNGVHAWLDLDTRFGPCGTTSTPSSVQDRVRTSSRYVPAPPTATSRSAAHTLASTEGITHRAVATPEVAGSTRAPDRSFEVVVSPR